ncbi:MAG: hypothetical protein KW788_04750 [Candidatus Doudnabacteria bacterium]|nr:hypothetical protein [Candidatus Doudnabacteria bacterium]
MKKITLVLVSLIAMIITIACGSDSKSSAGGSRQSPAAPTATSYKYENVTVFDVQQPQNDGKLAVFIYGNVLSALEKKVPDANGAMITIREHSSSSVKNWTAPYGNTVVDLHPGTIIRDITTTGKVDLGARLEPYGWTTPTQFAYYKFESSNRTSWVLLPLKFSVAEIAPEWRIQGDLPPVNNGMTASTTEGDEFAYLRSQWVPRVGEAKYTWLSRVESLDGRLICEDTDRDPLHHFNGVGACQDFRDR